MNNLTLKRILRRLKPETLLWAVDGYPVPVPFQIKINTLFRYSIPNSDWIETGTYLAETTLFLAKRNQKNKIYTIEPAKTIHNFVSSKYSKIRNIEFLHGTSEALFNTTLEKTQTSINLWLDGHYSGDVTFKGEVDSPIVHELEALTRNLNRYNSIRVFVDDFRLFGTAAGYPTKEYLVEWADSNEFSWIVENDIFIAQKDSVLTRNT